MAEVEFQYNGILTIIPCKEDTKIDEIINNFIFKSNINENEINYFYHDKVISQNNRILTFNQTANSFDKLRKKIEIIVKNNIKQDDNKNIDKDKDNICHCKGGYIQMKIRIGIYDVGEVIYFLENIHGKALKKYENYYHDFLKELNESNVELFINNKKYNFQRYFIPDKEGNYDILLKFNNLMSDCSFMFYKCSNLINIDLSLFKTENVTNMSSMFFGCSNLNNLNLESINTQNVTDMSHIFSCCYSLTNIDLSSFNTQNVTNMSGMFSKCYNLINLDLSMFNTQNVRDLSGMFSQCYNLTNIDLSKFNTQNVDITCNMFYDCFNLLNINLSSFNTQNVTNMYCMFNGCSKLNEIKINKNLGKRIMNIIDKNKIKFN